MPYRIGPIESESQRLADAVYDRVGAAIIDGTLEPGTRVRDQEIAAELGVSRMPVREALQRLERIGLIEMSASRFTRVTDISPEEIADSMEFLGFQVAAAARMAVPRMNDDERADAVELANAVAATADDHEDVQRIDDAANALWNHLVAASGNRVFTRVYREAWLSVERAQRGRAALAQTTEAIAAGFRELAGAIDTEDAEKAETIIRAQFRLGEVDGS